MANKDYYQVLGLSKSASADEVKRAFRRLAMEHHPDKGGNQEKFKDISEAYQVLSDPQKKQQYDQFGQTFENLGGGQGFNWQDFSQAYGSMGNQSYGFDFQDLGDIVGDLFGFGSQRGGAKGGSRARRGQDIEIEVAIELKDAFLGAEKSFGLEKKFSCVSCQGQGAQPGTKIINCGSCKGSGQIKQSQSTFLGTFQSVRTCPACGGEGQKPEKECGACVGSGVQTDKKDLKIKIPAGIDSGQTIRITGQGEAGIKKGAPGDLYVHVRVKPDKFFSRQGSSILSKEYLEFPMAALGGKITAKTITGEVDLKIPPGTKSSQIFKIKGRGMPDLNGYSAGDQLVEVILKVPERLSTREKQLLKELAKEMGVNV